MKGFSKAKGLPWPREAVSREIHSRSRGSLGAGVQAGISGSVGAGPWTSENGGWEENT